MKKSPWDIAEKWYSEAQTVTTLSLPEYNSKIPRDVTSPEFGKWLTNEYRLAMAKGIQLGREESV